MNCLFCGQDFQTHNNLRFIHLSLSLLQMDVESEGRTYIERYQVGGYPHIAILDPRTGRLLWRKEGWMQENPFTATQFAEMATDFCSKNTFDRPPQAPRAAAAAAARPAKRPMNEMSEAEQLEAAMRASMADVTRGADNEDVRPSSPKNNAEHLANLDKFHRATGRRCTAEEAEDLLQQSEDDVQAAVDLFRDEQQRLLPDNFFLSEEFSVVFLVKDKKTSELRPCASCLSEGRPCQKNKHHNKFISAKAAMDMAEMDTASSAASNQQGSSIAPADTSQVFTATVTSASDGTTTKDDDSEGGGADRKPAETTP